jgi:hypothetical protein
VPFTLLASVLFGVVGVALLAHAARSRRAGTVLAVDRACPGSARWRVFLGVGLVVTAAVPALGVGGVLRVLFAIVGIGVLLVAIVAAQVWAASRPNGGGGERTHRDPVGSGPAAYR